MKLGYWDVVLDGKDGYTISKTDDDIIIVTYKSHVITTVHINKGQPAFVTSNAIIRVDTEKYRIVICTPDDGIDRFTT